MGIHISQSLTILAGLARIGQWDDEISFPSTHRITIESKPKLPWLVQRIIAIVLRSLEALLSTITGRTIALIDHSKAHQDLTETITQLKTLFGEGRVERTMAWGQIDLAAMYRDGRRLTKQDFATFFHCLALITKEDVDDLLRELNGDHPCVRGVEGESLRTLRARFHEKREISDCSSEDIQELESILLPFSTPHDLFWNSPQDHVNTISLPISTFDMIEGVAWAQHLIRTRRLSLQDWEHLVAKRLSQAQLPNHLLVRHPHNGYLCFSHLVEGGGASKRFFASLHPQNIPPVILYRGTRGPMPGDGISDTMKSWLEDLRRELGSSGPIATYDATKQLLENPELGFVSSPAQGIALIANSIGGAQAQREAVYFHNRIVRLSTHCSPGVDGATAELFRSVMSQPRETPMIITHTIDKGDIVDTVGDEHIGANCPNIRLIFRALSPVTTGTQNEAAAWTTSNRLHDFLCSNIPALFSNIVGIFEAHARATTAEAYREAVISTDNPETRELATAYAQHRPPHFDPSWEQARRFFCPVPSPGFAEFARQCLAK